MTQPIIDGNYIQIGWWNFDGEMIGFRELDDVKDSDLDFWSPAFALKDDVEKNQ